MKFSRSRSLAAFTLLEIMIVVVIIVLLLGFAISKMGGALDVAKEARVRGDIQSIGTQLMVYQTLNGFLPSTEQGLKALTTKPESEPKPRSWRKLMDDAPIDAFGHEYHYVQPGVHNPDKYDLFSGGPDGKPSTADDMGNWKQE